MINSAWLYDNELHSDARICFTLHNTESKEADAIILKELPIHSAIVASASEYFRARLSADWRRQTVTTDADEATEPAAKARKVSSGGAQVVIEEIHTDEVPYALAVIRAIYEGKFELDKPEDLVQAAAFADRWGCNACLDVCLSQLSSKDFDQLSIDSMARMLGLRSSGTTIPNSRHYASIIQRCGDCITTRFRSAYDIMTDRDLRDGFVELPYDLILAWADSDGLDDGEDDIVGAISYWWLHNMGAAAGAMQIDGAGVAGSGSQAGGGDVAGALAGFHADEQVTRQRQAELSNCVRLRRLSNKSAAYMLRQFTPWFTVSGELDAAFQAITDSHNVYTSTNSAVTEAFQDALPEGCSWLKGARRIGSGKAVKFQPTFSRALINKMFEAAQEQPDATVVIKSGNPCYYMGVYWSAHMSYKLGTPRPTFSLACSLPGYVHKEQPVTAMPLIAQNPAKSVQFGKAHEGHQQPSVNLSDDMLVIKPAQATPVVQILRPDSAEPRVMCQLDHFVHSTRLDGIYTSQEANITKTLDIMHRIAEDNLKLDITLRPQRYAAPSAAAGGNAGRFGRLQNVGLFPDFGGLFEDDMLQQALGAARLARNPEMRRAVLQRQREHVVGDLERAQDRLRREEARPRAGGEEHQGRRRQILQQQIEAVQHHLVRIDAEMEALPAAGAEPNAREHEEAREHLRQQMHRMMQGREEIERLNRALRIADQPAGRRQQEQQQPGAVARLVRLRQGLVNERQRLQRMIAADEARQRQHDAAAGARGGDAADAVRRPHMDPLFLAQVLQDRQQELQHIEVEIQNVDQQIAEGGQQPAAAGAGGVQPAAQQAQQGGQQAQQGAAPPQAGAHPPAQP